MYKLILTVLSMVQTNTAFSTISPRQEAVQEQQSEIFLSLQIAKGYLQKRKAEYSDGHHKDWSVDKKVFGDGSGCSAYVELHDMRIFISREECNGESVVILKTSLLGSVEEFEDRNLLAHEKKMLKFLLIHAYFDNLEKIDEENRYGMTKTHLNILLDPYTKVTQVPAFLTMTKQDSIGYRTYEVVSTTHKIMHLITVFTAAEFDALVKKYFI